MAESQPKKERPTEEEGLAFAKVLYNYIWQTFSLTLTDDEDYIPTAYTDNFQEIIAKAVICEQLLTRPFLKSIIINSNIKYMKESDAAFILCKVICDRSPTWDFFKKLLRYSALIAEFFIYRTECQTPLELIKAPLIWYAIFKKYFAKDFYSKDGWKGLADYSQRYIEVFSSLEPVIDRLLLRCPYLNVYTDNYLEFPEDPNMPMTHGGDINIELEATFKNFDSHFAWKARAGKHSRNRKESAIFELSEDESSSSSASRSSSSSYQSSKDPFADPPGLSTLLENLGKASTSSTGEPSQQSGAGASTSKEELPTDHEDLGTPKLLEEIESRKRTLLTDVSDNDGPTKAKHPKPSDSPE